MDRHGPAALAMTKGRAALAMTKMKWRFCDDVALPVTANSDSKPRKRKAVVAAMTKQSTPFGVVVLET
jgi:hypothetical protein